MVVMSVSQRTIKSAKVKNQAYASINLITSHTVPFFFQWMGIELRGRWLVIDDLFSENMWSLCCLLRSSSSVKCLKYGNYHNKVNMHYMFNYIILVNIYSYTKDLIVVI